MRRPDLFRGVGHRVGTATLVVLALATFAHAQESSQPPGVSPLFGLRPGLFGKTTLEKGHYQFAVKPGASVDDSVEVLNLITRPLTLTLYGIDLDQSGSAVSAKQPTERQKGVGRWILLERTQVQLGPKDSIKVPFSVSVPEDVSAGDHLGAVMASTTAGEGRPGTLTVESRVGLTVRVRIPGKAILDGELGPLRISNTGGDRRFSIEVRNGGTLLFNVDGRIEIIEGSEVVDTLQLSPKDIYVIADGRARLEAVWRSTPLFGRRSARAVLDLTADHEPRSTVASSVVSASFFSWLTILVSVMFVIAAAVSVFLLRRRSSGRRVMGRQKGSSSELIGA